MHQVVPGSNADGRIELFGIAADGSVWHTWQTAPNNGWSEWTVMDGPRLRNMTVASNADGHLEIFATGPDDKVWHIWQTAPNSGWSEWTLLFTPNDRMREVFAGRNADGRLEVFGIGTDLSFWHTWQTQPNNGWSGWNFFDGPSFRRIVVASNADGHLELFGIAQDNKTWHIWQTAPNNGWSEWNVMWELTDKFQMLAAHQNWDGRLDLYAVAPDGSPWVTWQTAPSNGWAGWNLDINLILVVPEHFSQADFEDIHGGLEITRKIYASAGIRLRGVKWYQISAGAAGGYEVIDSNSEAEDLTSDWTVPNHSIDVFVVRVLNGNDGESGISPVGGPCDKDKKGMNGAVVSLNGNVSDTGQILAHEIGHYLGLDHVDFLNLMFPAVVASYPTPFSSFVDWQINIIKSHCFIYPD
jgi:hypothetical protein